MKRLKDTELAIAELTKGQLIIVRDESVSLLVYAASFCTPEYMNMMMNRCRGDVTLAMPRDRAVELGFVDTDERGLVSVDVCEGVQTGMSSNDRCHTVLRTLSSSVCEADFRRNGYVKVQPISSGACLVTPGVAEAAYDLVRLAGNPEGAVFSELLSESGCALSDLECKFFADDLSLMMVSLNDVIEYRLHKEPLVEALNIVDMPTAYGDFRLHVYNVIYDPARGVDLALTCGKEKFDEDETVLVRVHSEWSISNIVNRLTFDEGSFLNRAMKEVSEAGSGVIVFLRNTPEQASNSNIFSDSVRPNDIWMENGRVKTLQPADGMSYGLGAQILRDLGVRKMRLLSNSPVAFEGITNYGLEIVEQVNF